VKFKEDSYRRDEGEETEHIDSLKNVGKKGKNEKKSKKKRSKTTASINPRRKLLNQEVYDQNMDYLIGNQEVGIIPMAPQYFGCDPVNPPMIYAADHIRPNGGFYHEVSPEYHHYLIPISENYVERPLPEENFRMIPSYNRLVQSPGRFFNKDIRIGEQQRQTLNENEINVYEDIDDSNKYRDKLLKYNEKIKKMISKREEKEQERFEKLNAHRLGRDSGKLILRPTPSVFLLFSFF
jgi:hypothetical protein